MDIRYILDQEKLFTDVRDFVFSVTGISTYDIADHETGEVVICNATAQDILALGDRSLRAVNLSIVDNTIRATLFTSFYGAENVDLKNY